MSNWYTHRGRYWGLIKAFGIKPIQPHRDRLGKKWGKMAGERGKPLIDQICVCADPNINGRRSYGAAYAAASML